MNTTRDEIIRMLMVMMLRHPDSISDINSLNLLRYDDAFKLTDDLQIPYLGLVKSLIADIPSGGGAGTVIDKIITMSGDDARINNDENTIDLSAETDIPNPCVKPIVYVNDFGGGDPSWNKSTNILMGAPSVSPTDVIEIYFVGRQITGPTVDFEVTWTT